MDEVGEILGLRLPATEKADLLVSRGFVADEDRERLYEFMYAHDPAHAVGLTVCYCGAMTRDFDAHVGKCLVASGLLK